MIPDLRQQFNGAFTQERYQNFVDELAAINGRPVEFRLCETPLFLSNVLRDKLVMGVNDICRTLQTDDFMAHANKALPAEWAVPNEAPHPLFLQIDFAICRDSEGNVYPQLVELQGFPSLYAFQTILGQVMRRHFTIPDDMKIYFGGYDVDSYEKLLQRVLVADSDPENVILLEIEPEKQKTRIDFVCTEKITGIKPVCITEVYPRGNRLLYERDGREIPIERIYNRVIFDELHARNIPTRFDFKHPYDVNWVGHPNWFFKISKYSMPFLRSPFVPVTFFLNRLSEYPPDLENYVLKPLYSFAGSGVDVDVTRDKLDAIANPENYILQKKIEYAPLIETPDQAAKVEIRMMLIWEDNPVLVNNLIRVSKGKMMGVDYNKNQTWIGAHVAYHYA